MRIHGCADSINTIITHPALQMISKITFLTIRTTNHDWRPEVHKTPNLCWYLKFPLYTCLGILVVYPVMPGTLVPVIGMCTEYKSLAFVLCETMESISRYTNTFGGNSQIYKLGQVVYCLTWGWMQWMILLVPWCPSELTQECCFSIVVIVLWDYYGKRGAAHMPITISVNL